MRVVAGRDRDQPRLVGARDRRDDVLDERQELLAPGARRDRQVDGVALALALAGVLGGAGAGIERPLVDARVEHVGRGGEDLLGAVAVVDVPVEDQHPLGAARGDRVPGGDGDVVEQAEAHRAVALGVVAGRAQAAERRPRLAGEQPLGRVAPRRRRRAAPRRRTRREATVSMSIMPPPRGAERLDRVDVRAAWTRVSCSRVAAGASTRSRPGQPARSSADSIAHQPAGVLGMRAGVVLERGGMREVERHASAGTVTRP